MLLPGRLKNRTTTGNHIIVQFFLCRFWFFVFPADTEFGYFYINCILISIAYLLAVAEFIYSFLGAYKPSFKSE